MGCASSKVDDLPAVILCRDRLTFLSQALHQRYTFSEAHVAYIHSLESVGLSLHRFFDASATSTSIPPPSSPPPPPPPPQHKLQDSNHHNNKVDSSGHLSHSNSGSHLHFHSDSDDSDDDDDELHDHHHHDDHDESGSGSGLGSGPNSPPTKGGMMYDGGGGVNGFHPYLYANGGGYHSNMQMNYMRKHVTPSVSYEQKPVPFETVHFGDPHASSSSSSSTNYYNSNYNNNNNNDYYNGSNINSYNGNGYMNYGGFFGVPGARGGGGGGYGAPVVKKEATPPPPPPPPTTSSWDFMNLFESIEAHYPPYTPSRDSREVREEEGIPDLEDEDYYQQQQQQHEVVKEVHGHQKLVDESHVEGKGKGEEEKEEVVESGAVEYEVHVVDKKVVSGGEEGKSEQQPKLRSVFEIVREIQVQFERAAAAAAGGEIVKVLEVGKLRYHRKNAAFQVSAKMLNVITPSFPSTSRDDASSVDPDEDVQLRSVNLSATLQKLYLWEKKLFEEVKNEEKMRVSHDRKADKLKRLIDKGAEPTKIESTRNVVRGLSTKIRIAIQIVDKISVKINKLRDEELWPQLNELIQGLSRMWKAMLECHHSQCVAIDGARGLDAIAFPNNPSDTHLEASLQLEHDLLNWTCRFTEWIGAQKGYVSALNGWLMKCISTEPEETDDGTAPFSPGRAGAPPVFVICHQWNQSLERISETSEKDLIDSMRVFSMMVLHFRERDKGELRQRMAANRDMERKVKNMEKEDTRMQKKMVLASGDPDGLSLSGHVVYQSDTSSKTSLQAGLRHVFEAMDRFAADSVKAYEELLQRSEEVVQEHGRVS